MPLIIQSRGETVGPTISNGFATTVDTGLAHTTKAAARTPPWQSRHALRTPARQRTRLIFMRRAFSLIEILVVVAIIAILVAIVLPALIKSKKSAVGASDISDMHQMSLAAAIYHSDYSCWPRGTADLVSLRLAPKDLCASANDRVAEGMANQVAYVYQGVGGERNRLVVDYKSTFIGQRECRVNDDVVRQWVEPGTNGGWLIDMTMSDLPENGGHFGIMNATGRYRRLMYDGSVGFKTLSDSECALGPCRVPEALFFDPDEDYKSWLKSHG
jgi:prepilin-type N-terminal cleavage/methylation domain-containing protein